jgi:hypothetical protein
MTTINSLADLVENSLLKYADKPAFHCLGQTLIQRFWCKSDYNTS